MKFKLLIIILSIVLSFSVAVNAINNELSNFHKIKKYNLRNIITTYTTHFDTQDNSRSKNIKLAAKMVDGKLIKPGEVFSFNQTVGPRTKKRGFEEAVEIVNNEFVVGVGGGICQVSSTIYNSVLFSGLDIIKRDNHSRPVNYVPLGRGATVYYNAIDFKFKNNFSNPIMIMSKVLDGQLTITLLGTDPGINVKVVTSSPEILEPQVIEKIDYSLQPGTKKVIQSGQVGYKVMTRRIIKNGKKTIKNQLVSEDIYPPVDKVIKVAPENN